MELPRGRGGDHDEVPGPDTRIAHEPVLLGHRDRCQLGVSVGNGVRENPTGVCAGVILVALHLLQRVHDLRSLGIRVLDAVDAPSSSVSAVSEVSVVPSVSWPAASAGPVEGLEDVLGDLAQGWLAGVGVLTDEHRGDDAMARQLTAHGDLRVDIGT